jgi:DNA-binding NarL/FixJ family response regulator
VGVGHEKERQVTRRFLARKSETKREIAGNGNLGQKFQEPLYMRGNPQPRPPTNQKKLANREREVVRLLAEGNSNKEIASLMGITAKTVETYRTRIMSKLDIHSIAHLVRYAVQNKLVVF